MNYNNLPPQPAEDPEAGLDATGIRHKMSELWDDVQRARADAAREELNQALTGDGLDAESLAFLRELGVDVGGLAGTEGPGTERDLREHPSVQAARIALQQIAAAQKEIGGSTRTDTAAFFAARRRMGLAGTEARRAAQGDEE